MSRLNRFGAELLLVLAGVASAAAQEGPLQDVTQPAGRGRERPNVARASCVIRVESNLPWLPLNDNTLRGLVQSSGISGTVAQAALGEAGDEGLEFDATFQALNRTGDERGSARVGSDMLIGQIEVMLRGAKADSALAERYLAETCKQLMRVIEEQARADVAAQGERMKAADAAVAAATKHYAELQAQRDAMVIEFGGVGLSTEEVRGQLANRANEHREIQSRLSATEAEREAITRLIAESEAMVANRLREDPVLEELSRIVALREADMKRLEDLLKAGTASDSDLNDSVARLAEARIEMARRREEVARGVGEERLTQLNQQLARLPIESGELQARLGSVAGDMDRLQKALPMVARFEREIRLPLEAAEGSLGQTIRARDELRARLDSARPPQITILGGVR